MTVKYIPRTVGLSRLELIVGAKRSSFSSIFVRSICASNLRDLCIVCNDVTGLTGEVHAWPSQNKERVTSDALHFVMQILKDNFESFAYM